MTKIKIFKSIESEIESLELEVNQWLANDAIHVISMTGNIAPQTTSTTMGMGTGAFSSSDILLIIHYEDKSAS